MLVQYLNAPLPIVSSEFVKYTDFNARIYENESLPISLTFLPILTVVTAELYFFHGASKFP